MATVYYERLVTEDLDTGVNTVTKRNPGGGSLVGTQVGIHSLAVSGAKVTAVWDPGSVPVGGSVTTTVSVSGASVGDFVLASLDTPLQGLILTGSVSSTSVVTVVLANLAGAPVDLPSANVSVLVLKSR